MSRCSTCPISPFACSNATSMGRHPEHPVASSEPLAGTGAEGDGELLPQEQVLEHERLAATERGAHSVQEEHYPVRNATMMAHGAGRHRCGVLAPYRTQYDCSEATKSLGRVRP